MIKWFKRSWQDFKSAAPGDRFQAQHRAGGGQHRRPWLRMLRLLLGALLSVVGLILMPAPGPGMPVVALGLVLMAHESLMVARALDAAELRLRPVAMRLLRWWRKRRR